MNIPRIGVIIRKVNRYLCVFQAASKLWGFPKGRLKEFESYKEGACRELREETGIVLSPDILDSNNIIHIKRGKHHHYYYIHEVIEYPIVNVDNYEIIDHRWMTLYELSKMDRSFFTEQAIKRINNNNNNSNPSTNHNCSARYNHFTNKYNTSRKYKHRYYSSTPNHSPSYTNNSNMFLNNNNNFSSVFYNSLHSSYVNQSHFSFPSSPRQSYQSFSHSKSLPSSPRQSYQSFSHSKSLPSSPRQSYQSFSHSKSLPSSPRQSSPRQSSPRQSSPRQSSPRSSSSFVKVLYKKKYNCLKRNLNVNTGFNDT
jgi:8-oxo-dGTP pyrophosphatase MutT (NUDIX family)